MMTGVRTDFQRAPDAPPLPATPFRFVCYFVRRCFAWYLAMVAFEAAHATCGILLPYALGQIVRIGTSGRDPSMVLVDRIRAPLALFDGVDIKTMSQGALHGHRS
jgi:ATP-binding cassette subfamily B protein